MHAHAADTVCFNSTPFNEAPAIGISRALHRATVHLLVHGILRSRSLMRARVPAWVT
jgi:hypothetical protein